MSWIMRLAFMLSLIFYPLSAFSSASDLPRSTPIVAAATAHDALRFVGSSTVCQMRVHVVTVSNETTFDSGWHDGNVLDWPTANVTSGAYRCIISVSDLDGVVTSKEMTMTADAGTVHVEQNAAEPPKITLVVNDGTSGSIVTSAGDLTFRFGNFLTAEDQERMRVTADGRVGIGTNNPQASLDVNGVIRTTKGIEFPDGTLLTSAAAVSTSTPAPGTPASPRRPAVAPGTAPSSGAPLRNPVSKPKLVGPGTGPQFVVDSTGVHIGTTPTYGLSVFGNVNTQSNLQLPLTTDASAGVLMIDDVPYLHAFGFQNLFVGYAAGNFSTAGGYNTGIGGYSLANNADGQYNTAVGLLALQANASGNYNTAVGTSALAANNGDNNTGVGNSALGNNANGTDNTAIGYLAGLNNRAGTRNTAVGSQALLLANGYDNSALGYQALKSNQVGVSNVAVGSKALSDNVGNFNTALGTEALQNNTIAMNNTAVGFLSLRLNTTGANNTAVGRGSLGANSTGSYNTVIGYSAASSLQSGSHNVLIGDNAGLNIDAGSQNICIGTSPPSDESNTIRIGSGNQTRAFIAGIRGITTASANAIPVLIDSNGQLGTASSSRRFKYDIRDAGDSTADLMRLRPVTFRYLAHGPDAPLQYGLIAEEVADVYPELVARDQNGQVETVMYQFLPPMLLNEFQKQQRQIGTQQRKIDTQQQTIDELRQEIDSLARRLQELEAEHANR
jgi:hypothetical protein